eukprot:TRINITY_DN7598_c0_g1_i2.p1 TRINITY_DN7598_c0_g1~~TRINITY_DN7598_c0_g1_i2.p1  ORF type:complete len:900 (-),score=207.85 TRINITY_DN7598_c0_g1_i2:139-2838(-)
MEFAAFNEKDFDLKKWINESLRNKQQESVEKHASTLRLKLQHLSSELGNSIEELSSQALLRIPRGIRDIENIKKDTGLLREKIHQFEQKLQKLEIDTESSVSIVAQLDDVKTKMEQCVLIISNAEKFKTMLAEIEKTFETSDSEKIAVMLEEMEQVVQVLKPLPQYQNAPNQMVQYTKRLESLVRPKLIQTFTSQNTEMALKYVEIFKKIGQQDQVLNYYYNCRKLPMNQVWEKHEKKYPVSAVAAAVDSKLFSEWIPSFYDDLQLSIHNELKWSQKIFPKSTLIKKNETSHYEVVANLLHKFFDDIRPSFQQRLNAPQNTLIEIISSYSYSKEFLKTLDFLSFLEDSNVPIAVGKSLLQAFHQHQENYMKLETKLSKQRYESIKPSMKSSDFLGVLNTVDSFVPKLFDLIESTVDRCLDLTEGVLIKSTLSNVVELILEDFLNELKNILNHLTKLTSGNVNMESNSPDVDSPTLKSSQTLNKEEKGAKSLIEFEENFQEWGESYFQGALQFLYISDKLVKKLETLDQQVKSMIISRKMNDNNYFITTSEGLKISFAELCYSKKQVEGFYEYVQLYEDDSSKLFKSTYDKYTKFHGSDAQSFVFESMFGYIKQKLIDLPCLEEWSEEMRGQIPKHSITPQGYIKLIVEHLLVIRQMLEPYDHNNQQLFSYGSQSPQSLDDTSENPVDMQIKTISLDRSEIYFYKDRKIKQDTHKNKPTISNPTNSSASTNTDVAVQNTNENEYLSSLLFAVWDEESKPEDNNNEKGPISSEETEKIEESTKNEENDDYQMELDDQNSIGFALQWIESVAKATMILYLEKILEIPKLSEIGATQLAVDIAHLFNVLKALDVTPEPLLQFILDTVNLSTKEQFDQEYANTNSKTKQMISKIIGKKRGWSEE